MVDTATPRLPLTDAPWVDDSFVRRVRALLRTAPLHDLEAGKALRDGDWSPYDLRGLALAAIDTVIDHMGLEFGATGEQVRQRLAQLARMSAPDRPPEESRRVADAVVTGLLNDRHRREAFALPYSDWSGRRHRRAEVAFKLLEEVEAPDGSVVLRATDEAVILFVGALDRDIADAHAAAEAILASQLRRGRLDQAVHTARAARLRSIQYASNVERVLDATRHDIRQVDWQADVPDLLADALAHLAERLETERHLVATVRGLAGEHDTRPAAGILLDLIEDCQLRHLELHALLLRARTTFLEEQERQRFTVSTDSRAFELGDQLLGPLLACTAAEGLPAVARFVAGVTGPVPPRPVRLSDMIDLLLQPRRGEDGAADDGDTPELIDLGDDRRFAPAAWEPEDPGRARALVDDLLTRIDEGADRVDRAGGAAAGAAADVRRFVTDDRFSPLDGPIRERLGSDPVGVARDNATLVDQLRMRLTQCEQKLEELTAHRRLLVREIAADTQRGLWLLRQADQVSALPAGFGEWSDQRFLQIRYAARAIDDELLARLEVMVDELVDEGVRPAGVPLLQRAVHAAVGVEGFAVQILKPNPALRPQRVPVTELATFSGGEQLTAAILLYCTLARLRAQVRQTQTAGGMLTLDNPIGTSSNVTLLQLQRRLADAMGVQLVYATAVDDREAVGVLPHWIRLRNERRDARSGNLHVERATVGESEQGRVEATHMWRRADTVAVVPRGR